MIKIVKLEVVIEYINLNIAGVEFWVKLLLKNDDSKVIFANVAEMSVNKRIIVIILTIIKKAALQIDNEKTSLGASDAI